MCFGPAPCSTTPCWIDARQKIMTPTSECTVVVPVRTTSCTGLSDLVACYVKAVEEACFPIDVLLIDNSPDDVAAVLRDRCLDTRLGYAFLPHNDRVSKNQKMDAVWYGLSLATTEKVILLDDDVRPTATNIELLCADLDQYSFVKCIVDVAAPTVLDRIDLAGIYAYNRLSRYGQSWANISFRKSVLLRRGFPLRDVLYDELAIEKRFRGHSELFYRDAPPLFVKPNRGLRLFLNQRRRYAYENIGMPFRFAADLCVLPGLTMIGRLVGLPAALLVGTLITLVVMWASWTYEKRLPQRSSGGRVWPFAAAWYWFYPFFSWVALACFVTGGVAFQHKRIWRPV